MPQNEYSFRLVDSILTQYLDIEEGTAEILRESSGSHRQNAAPFESQLIMKADIDTAIESLGSPGAWSRQSQSMQTMSNELSHKQRSIYKYTQAWVDTPVGLIYEIVRILQ